MILVPSSRTAVLVVLLTCIYLSLAAQPSPGQDSKRQDSKKQEKPYALIFGTVWGPDNRPIYGVHVKIRRAQDKKSRWDLYSDHNGEFAERVPAGRTDYVIWADLKGYKLQNGKKLQPGPEVTVHVENDERIDTGLHLTQ